MLTHNEQHNYLLTISMIYSKSHVRPGSGHIFYREARSIVWFNLFQIVTDTRKRKGLKEGIPALDNYLDKL